MSRDTETLRSTRDVHSHTHRFSHRNAPALRVTSNDPGTPQLPKHASLTSQSESRSLGERAHMAHGGAAADSGQGTGYGGNGKKRKHIKHRNQNGG